MGGLALAAALPPFGWWPLAPIGVALVALATSGRPAPGRFGIGYVAGLAFLAPGLYWMAEFSTPGYVLSVLVESALFALAFAVAPSRGFGAAIGVPAALVASEALRGVWPFGGVPIATLAQTQIGGPVSALARVGGGLAMAAAVAVAGVVLAALARRRWAPGLVGASVVGVVVVAGFFAPDGRSIGQVDVALVQGGGDTGTRTNQEAASRTFNAHLRASQDVPSGLDLVVWPEDVVDVDEPLPESPEGRRLDDLARRLGSTFVVGVVQGGERSFTNTAVAYGEDGEVVDTYEKNQRVPFGEYIPLRSLVERVADVSAVPRDAEVGRGPALLETDVAPLGVVISYEVFFPRRARSAIQAGAELLLVPTNAASFSTAQMPAIELGAARLRAIETGRVLLQTAPTGFTAIVEPDGRVRQVTDLGAASVLEDQVALRSGSTLYTRSGDAPFVVTTVVALAVAWAGAAAGAGARRR